MKPSAAQITDWLDQMMAEQERRHAWLYEAGEQIRKWKREEEESQSIGERRG